MNHKLVYRIMRANNLRPDKAHDGKVVVMRSDLRWCSVGFEVACGSGDIIPGAFIVGAHGLEIIARLVVVNAYISGSVVRDMKLEAVEARFATVRAPQPIERRSDNGLPDIARDTRSIARQLGMKPCFTPMRSPQGNGIAEALAKTLKRDGGQFRKSGATGGRP